MMNIGYNPTVGGKKLSVEIHFFDFDDNIYGMSISVSILHYIRAEQKFESVEYLSVQLKKDKIATLEFLNL